MKKLLAIAVAAAITVPMAASADTKVYGKVHAQLNKVTGGKWDVKSSSSRIGLKGSNALDNGLTATHKLEMDVDGLVNDQDGKKKAPIQARDSWVGLKGAFGEVRVGRHTVPSDIMDDAADFMTNGGAFNEETGRVPNALAYIGKFGNVGFAAARVQPGNDAGVAHDLMANYKAGPIYAGAGVTALKDGKAGAKVALAYKGANYGVGLVAGKTTLDKAAKDANKNADTFTTVSGKYGFGKAYAAAEFGSLKIDADDSSDTSFLVELGYGLGKSTKTYVDFKSVKDDSADKTTKSTNIGLVHSF